MYLEAPRTLAQANTATHRAPGNTPLSSTLIRDREPNGAELFRVAKSNRLRNGHARVGPGLALATIGVIVAVAAFVLYFALRTSEKATSLIPEEGPRATGVERGSLTAAASSRSDPGLTSHRESSVGASALLQCEVVEKSTGEGVPYIRVELLESASQQQGSSPRVTDERGRILLSRSAVSGSHRLVIKDPEIDYEHFERTSGNDRVANNLMQVSIEIGPTYFLNIQLPDSEPDDAVHHLIARLTIDRGLDLELPWQHVRLGNIPWIRFPAGVRSAESYSADGIFIQIRNPAGTLLGRARIAKVSGTTWEPIPVRLGHTSGIRGVAQDAGGVPLPGVHIGLHLENQAAEQSYSSSGPDDRDLTDDTGGFALSGLPPGVYKLTARKEGYYVSEVRVTLAPGEVWFQRLELGAGTAITGRLEYFGTVSHGLPRIGLRSKEGAAGTTSWATPIVDKSMNSASNGTVARFSFLGVPPGKYEVFLRNSGVNNRFQGYTWVPHAVDVSATHNEDVVFRSERLGGVRAISFRVFDAETRTAIDTFAALDLTVPEQGYSNGSAADGVGIVAATNCQFGVPVRLAPLLRGSNFRWAITARGYEVVTGDEAAFSRDDSTLGAPLICDVYLRKGFGAVFQVFRDVGENTSEPLDDAEMIADGRPVCVTDDNGVAIVNYPNAPKRLEPRYPGFHVVRIPQTRVKRSDCVTLYVPGEWTPLIKTVMRRD